MKANLLKQVHALLHEHEVEHEYRRPVMYIRAGAVSPDDLSVLERAGWDIGAHWSEPGEWGYWLLGPHGIEIQASVEEHWEGELEPDMSTLEMICRILAIPY